MSLRLPGPCCSPSRRPPSITMGDGAGSLSIAAQSTGPQSPWRALPFCTLPRFCRRRRVRATCLPASDRVNNMLPVPFPRQARTGAATNLLEQIKKTRKRNFHTLRIIDFDPVAAGEACNRKRHCHAMIGEAPDTPATQRPPAVDRHAVFALLDLNAEPAEALRHCRDTIRFLVTELFHIEEVTDAIRYGGSCGKD